VIKRIFSIFLGLGIGLLVGAFVVRRMDQASRAVAPSNLAHQAGRAAGTFADRLRAAVAEGRVAMADKEAELRDTYRVPSVRETLGG
jgi:hypothetical protein